MTTAEAFFEIRSQLIQCLTLKILNVMIELVKYFRILFLSPKISRERLRDFCRDHLQRLTANNPGGVFTPIITALTTAYNAYNADLTAYLTKTAQKEGRTLDADNKRNALLKNISDNEKLVAFTYKDNMPVYEEFYPLGITEYTRSSVSELATLGERYLNILTVHAADFSAPFITAYTNLYNAYVAALNENSSVRSGVDTERSDLASSKEALALQMTKNLLTIALQYAGNESKADVYFDQSILNVAFRESEKKVTGEIDPGLTQNLFDNITKGELQLRMKNNGEGVLYIAFKADEETPATETDTAIGPGQEVTLNAAELGFTTVNKYLNITNLGTLIGSYEVEKV